MQPNPCPKRAARLQHNGNKRSLDEIIALLDLNWTTAGRMIALRIENEGGTFMNDETAD